MANTYVNKVQLADGTSLIDISDTTATADKILSGYTAYGADGSKLTGTATGGGSVTQDQDGFIVLPPTGSGGGGSTGLVYESGTYTPSADVVNPTISFADTHDNPPMSIIFYDATGTTDASSDSNCFFVWADYYQVSGQPITISNDKTEWARASYGAKSSATMISAWTYSVTTPYSNTASSTSTDYRFWVTASGFNPGANSSSTRYWRAGRTYKWIAVWAPTT